VINILRRSLRRLHGAQDGGAVATEFALLMALLPLTILACGIVDYGELMAQQTNLAAVVRGAAEYARVRFQIRSRTEVLLHHRPQPSSALCLVYGPRCSPLPLRASAPALTARSLPRYQPVHCFRAALQIQIRVRRRRTETYASSSMSRSPGCRPIRRSYREPGPFQGRSKRGRSSAPNDDYGRHP
jgi:Flp pilus assembly pilin Flp